MFCFLKVVNIKVSAKLNLQIEGNNKNYSDRSYYYLQFVDTRVG